MKKTLAITLILLANTQVQADGFYQKIVGDQPQSGYATSATTKSNYTPLYNQVLGNPHKIRKQKAARTASKTNYSPLYLRVTGNPS